MENRATYTTTQPQTWTVALPTADWTDLLKLCTKFIFQPTVAEHYAIDDSGFLYVNPEYEPDENAFRGLWEHLTALERSLPRAMGNAMNYAGRYFGDDLLDELMIASGRRESTLRQYKRVYNPHTGIAPERQRPGIKYSYDREAAPLPPEQQVALLDRIEAGEFENSDQVHAERLRIQKEPPRETFTETRLACPICGEQHAWDTTRLQWAECSSCHGKALELRDHLSELQDAVRALLKDGDIGPVNEYASRYSL